MALCNTQDMYEAVAREVRRDMIFRSLHRAHAAAWKHTPFKGDNYCRFYAWRVAWWKELEKAFPDKIKNGVVICPTHSVPSLYQYASKQSTWSSDPVVSLSSNGLFPEAIPCMQQSAIPGTFQEVTKGFGLTCSPMSKSTSKVSVNPGKSDL